ncbi:protein-L-isoaspartate O-methyltransferase [Streptomyces sp. FIT100]|uniref:protein-L-isoaspartate O-methyltransferase family protein n=1 Tax=Streptomyces sp. FIT100 TaxID=2837956 RepID=UPI0021C9AEB9|nr:rRNA adenine N-6-methyltransferase family protein [Streptomyces sp. FIT100]UUN30599.1 methyltransferase domain-containing protein [Streptomyces sp. FIT100]
MSRDGSEPTPEDLVTAARAAGVTDERLLGAMRSTLRAAFVPAAHRRSAYLDVPVPIAHGQVTTQPSLVAAMVAALRLTGGERVLEIGTGCGFQTALLARLSAYVVSIERWPDLAEEARAGLSGEGIANVTVVVGDGTLGVPEHAPYDAVVVSAAFPEVPGPPAGQLRPGGRLGRVSKVAPSARRAGPTASGACDRKAEGRSRTGRTWTTPTTQRGGTSRARRATGECVPGVVGQAGLSKHAPVQPIGPGGRELVTLYERGPRGLVRTGTVVAAHFVRLYGAHGYPPP